MVDFNGRRVAIFSVLINSFIIYLHLIQFMIPLFQNSTEYFFQMYLHYCLYYKLLLLRLGVVAQDITNTKSV